MHDEHPGEGELDTGLCELTTEAVGELWSRTYDSEDKPDWSHIFPYYHPEVVFQDPIQRLEGIDDFTAMCHRLTRRCASLDMEIINLGRHDGVIMMEWVMTMSFRRSPSTPIHGCTRLTLHEDGRIIEQRDYYDLWGDIFANVPGVRNLYRFFMAKLFG